MVQGGTRWYVQWYYTAKKVNIQEKGVFCQKAAVFKIEFIVLGSQDISTKRPSNRSS